MLDTVSRCVAWDCAPLVLARLDDRSVAAHDAASDALHDAPRCTPDGGVGRFVGAGVRLVGFACGSHTPGHTHLHGARRRGGQVRLCHRATGEARPDRGRARRARGTPRHLRPPNSSGTRGPPPCPPPTLLPPRATHAALPQGRNATAGRRRRGDVRHASDSCPHRYGDP